jgi:hypothetical protein
VILAFPFRIQQFKWKSLIWDDRFSDNWSTFYTKPVERPEKTAIGEAHLTMFTGIGSILALGMVKNAVIWEMSAN